MQKLQHPHIVQYYGAEIVSNKNNDVLWIYMEYIANGTLSELTRNLPVKTENLLRTFISQICIGLSFLHKNNICHRDIKGSTYGIPLLM